MAVKQLRSAKVLYLEFDSQTFQVAWRSFDPNITEVTVDGTSGTDALTSEHFIRTTCAPTASILVLDDAVGVLIRAKLLVGTTGNLIWGEEGNTGGQPKGGITARVKKANITFEHEGEQIIEVEWVNTSADWIFDPASSTF